MSRAPSTSSTTEPPPRTAESVRAALVLAAQAPCGCGECPTAAQLVSLLALDDAELLDLLEEAS